MNNDLMKRYSWLINTIKQSGESGLSYKEICTEWAKNKISDNKKYPLRTFHNHRKDILNELGVNIICNNVTNKYFIEKPKGRANKSNASKWQLFSSSVNNFISSYRNIQKRVSFDTSGIETQLTEFAAIIQQGDIINFKYSEFAYNNAEPYGIRFSGDGWTLLCRFEGEVYKFFNLGKIGEIELCDRQFIFPNGLDMEELFATALSADSDLYKEPKKEKKKAVKKVAESTEKPNKKQKSAAEKEETMDVKPQAKAQSKVKSKPKEVADDNQMALF